MKYYRFEIIIEEGNDEFWEELIRDNRSGCEEIFDAVKSAINNSPETQGFDATIILREYKNKE